jgi:two-component system OmpR family response regulator
MRILVVEDDRKVARFVRQGLEEEGHAVDVAADGEEGLQLAAELRREGHTVPILMLTARDSTEDVVRGLDSGADDYLTKPFAFDELVARVRALGRRGAAAVAAPSLHFADVELDRLHHRASRAGRPLDLTPREFRLLEYFLARPDEVVTRTELLEKVWDMSFDPESNVVDVHVSNLRGKLEEGARPRLIQTVRGVGFALREEG